MFDHFRLVLLALVCAVAIRPDSGVWVAPRASSNHADVSTHVQTAHLPVRFEANEGQWDAQVRYAARGGGAVAFLTDDGALLTVHDGATRSSIAMKVAGARPTAPIGEEELPTKSNFFLGNDPSRWRTNVSNFGRVRASGVLPGVDVEWHGGRNGVLEYDLAVAARTDASRLALVIEGARSLRVRDDGALVIETAAGPIVQMPPRVLQEGAELRAHYEPTRNNRVGLRIEGYDRTRAVLIDPTVFYSTYLGGSADEAGYAIAVDSSDNMYVTGYTSSTNFPLANAFQTTAKGNYDVWIAKLNAAGSSLVYSTYLGGASSETGRGIAVDSSGNAYVAGDTGSTNFPTLNALQATRNGTSDAFVTKLSASGSSLVFSTYLGGSVDETGYGIAVDTAGNAYVTGWTTSSNFPVTTGALQTTSGGGRDAFVTKLNASGASLSYSSYLGGANGEIGRGIAVDSTGQAYVAGSTQSANFPTTNGAYQTGLAGNTSSTDAFVAKVASTGASLGYSTYFGGTQSESANGIAIDSSGNAYIAGQTESTDLPLVNAYENTYGGNIDGFIMKLDAGGATLGYSTYLGGNWEDEGFGIAVDSSSNAYLIGRAQSSNLPTVSAIQSTCACGTYWVMMLAKFTSAGAASYVTYFGEQASIGEGIAINSSGDACLVGSTSSSAFPTANPYQSSNAGASDAVIARIGKGPLILAGATVSPKGTHTFAATGGSGGNVYSFQTNASGATINSTTGAYQAGATGNVTDVVLVTDSDNDTATANVTVGPPISVSPPSPTAAPSAALSFSASGGSNSGFVWSLSTNNSGGSIGTGTGAYKAGPTGNCSDTVTVTDSLGNAASVIVSVGPVVSITPTNAGVAANGNLTFAAAGGSGTGFTWSLPTNNSGGTINANTGAYTAGPTTNVSDVVKVVDSLGNVAGATVDVGEGGIAIVPPVPVTPPKGTLAFTPIGGSGSGYVWTLATNQSGGSINPSTGLYTAGATGGVADVVTLTDSAQHSTSVGVTVTDGIATNPSTITVTPGSKVAFSAAGGSGKGFTWSLSAGASGGTITPSGAYTSGATVDTTDSIQVVDSLGNTAEASVNVVAVVAADAGTQDASGANDAAPIADAADEVDAGASAGPSTGCGCGAAGASAGSTVPLLSLVAALLIARRRGPRAALVTRAPKRLRAAGKRCR